LSALLPDLLRPGQNRFSAGADKRSTPGIRSGLIPADRSLNGKNSDPAPGREGLNPKLG